MRWGGRAGSGWGITGGRWQHPILTLTQAAGQGGLPGLPHGDGVVPQAYKTLRSGEARALSLPMCLLRTSALASWLLYGLNSQSGPIAVANALSLLPMALVLERKLRNRRQEALHPSPKR